MRLITKLVLPLILLIICGCAPEATIVVTTIPETPEEFARAKEIWNKVEEQKNAIKNNPNWLNDSYNGIKIKSLANIPIERYTEYKKFLDEGKLYIINHPAYYTFFHHPKIERKDNTKNIEDIFITGEELAVEDSAEKKSVNRHNKDTIKIMREFERVERNFLEFKSAEQKLVILIIPGNYKKYSKYRYKNGNDEYARFINEATNLSGSVVYLESKKANIGQLIDEDLNTLVEFLHKIGVTSVLLGGEYVGRCQEDFYKQLSEAVSRISVEIVPELSPVSPDDMNKKIKNLLDSNNKLDIQAATYNIFNDTYQKLSITPKIINLKSRMSYEKPDEK